MNFRKNSEGRRGSNFRSKKIGFRFYYLTVKQCRNAHKTRKRQHFQQRQIPKRGGRVKGCLEYFRKFIHIEEQKRTTFLKDDRRIYGHEIMGKEVFLVNCSAPGGGCVPLQLPDSAELATQRSRIAATLPPARSSKLCWSSCR